MVEQLKARLPDMGDHVVVDSTDVEAYGAPNRREPADPDATWGVRMKKTKSGRKKETEPFCGYKMHSIADVIYGVPLAQIMLPGNDNDSPQLPKLLNKAQSAYPWLQPRYLMADKGYDAIKNHRLLMARDITPIIHARRPTAEDKLHDGLYDQRGRPVCDGKTPMEYVETDPATGRHRFRCPASGCKLKARSSGAVRYYDTTALWIDPSQNPRAIGVVARSTKEWKRLYSSRMVIEREFSSLKRSRILDRHQYVQQTKIELHLGLAVLTYLSTMLTRVDADDAKNIRHMRIRVGR